MIAHLNPDGITNRTVLISLGFNCIYPEIPELGPNKFLSEEVGILYKVTLKNFYYPSYLSLDMERTQKRIFAIILLNLHLPVS